VHRQPYLWISVEVLLIVVIEDVLGECTMVTLTKVTKPIKKLPVQNSILLKSPRLVFLKLSERFSLWVIELALAMAGYDLALQFQTLQL
jgi:hypothetical protein